MEISTPPARLGGGCTPHTPQWIHPCFVTKGNHGSLMGYRTAQALNLFKILQNINDATSTYPNLFKGTGKLKHTQVKIYVDESVKLVAQKPRHVPFHLRDKVEPEFRNF